MASVRRIEEEITDQVRELSVLSERLGHTFAARHGLHPTDLAALLAVLHAEVAGTPVTAGELTERLGVTSGAVTAVVDRLERRGHLRRRRDDRDRRKVYLHYGEAAQEVGAAFFGPLAGRSSALMATFTDNELAVVHRFLGGMLAATADSLAEVQDGQPG